MKLTLHEILKTERTLTATRPAPRTIWQSFLVPVDFTDRSREALKLAVSLAADPEDRITLLHVIEPEAWLHRSNAVMMTLRKSDGELRLEAEARLKRWAAQEAGPDLEVDTVVRVGPVHREILRAVETHHFDAIVLATQPKNWFERLFTGGLTRKLLRQAPCAVITIRPPAHPAAASSMFDPVHLSRDSVSSGATVPRLEAARP